MDDKYDGENKNTDEYEDSQDDEYENDDYDEESEYDGDGTNGHKKKSGIILTIIILIIAMCGGIYFGLNSNGDIFKKLQSAVSTFGTMLPKKTPAAAKAGSSSGSAASSAISSAASSTASSAVSSAASSASSSQKNDSGQAVSKDSTKLISFESDSNSKFEQYKNGFFYFTKDGARFFQLDGTQKWNDTYTLSNITAVSSGQYCAVYEMLGRNLRVYSDQGTAYSIQADGLITHCDINPSGSSTLILNCNDGYKVQVYSNNGTLLLERFDEDKGIYPVSSTLSDDGKILAVTYVDTSDVSLVSRILLFYTSRDDSKQTGTGDFYAAVQKDDSVIPFIKYNAKGYFTAISDSSIFAVDTSGKELWSTALNNKAEKAAVLESGDIAIALTDQIAGKDGYPYGTLLIIGAGGKTQAEVKTGQNITYLGTTEKGIVVGNGKNFTFLNETGKTIWTYEATQDVSDIIPFDTTGKKVLVVTANEARLEKLKK